MILSALTLAAALQGPLPSAEKPKEDPNKLICQQRLKTGSRVNFIHVCHTRAEWEMIRSENRRVIERGQANRGTKG